MISAVLLWERYCELKDIRAENIKNVIIEKIRYSTEKITMKSYFYLAEFILNRMKEDDLDDQTADALYRCFCHTDLVDEGENSTFVSLMESPNFHYFERIYRAEILIYIVLMYRSILNIKNQCCYTYTKKERDHVFPVHYTKLKTLKILLSNGTEGDESSIPKLRLWNTAYMNDSFEGGVFSKLLCHAVEKAYDNDADKKRETDEVASVLQIYFGDQTMADLQADSAVFVLSFSKALNNFQMWNIYADAEKGCAIRFDDDFFDIKDDYVDPIADVGSDIYSLYEVQYYDIEMGKIKDNNCDFETDMSLIWKYLREIENVLQKMKKENTTDDEVKSLLFSNALMEVRSFVADRLNEVRFLFKTQSYAYEQELRLIRCSHFPRIDEESFKIPRLYIDVDREINHLEVTLGGKLERQKVKDLHVWLSHTGKVERVSIEES